MEAYISPDVVEDLQRAKAKEAKRKARFCVHVGDNVYPILRLTHNGFVVSAESTPHLRGLVDVYDGPAHLWQCLIVRADKVGNTVGYEYKRNVRPVTGPVCDYAEDREKPIALLSS